MDDWEHFPMPLVRRSIHTSVHGRGIRGLKVAPAAVQL